MISICIQWSETALFLAISLHQPHEWIVADEGLIEHEWIVADEG